MEDATKNIHLSEVKMGIGPGKDGKNNEPCLVTAGSYVLTVSGVGDTVSEARVLAYELQKESQHD